MTNFLIEGGLYFTLPLLALAIAMLVLVVWNAITLASGSRDAALHGRLDLLLQLGIFSFVLGLLGQALGLYQMLKAIESIGAAVSPALIAGGLAVSAIAPIFGLIILTVSLLAWTVMRRWAA